MNKLLDATLGFVDELYPPSKKALDMRNELRAAMPDLPTEVSYLPYYAAQVSITITLLDNLTAKKTATEMRGETLKASVALTIVVGLMNAALGVTKEEGAVN